MDLWRLATTVDLGIIVEDSPLSWWSGRFQAVDVRRTL